MYSSQMSNLLDLQRLDEDIRRPLTSALSINRLCRTLRTYIARRLCRAESSDWLACIRGCGLVDVVLDITAVVAVFEFTSRTPIVAVPGAVILEMP